MINQPKFNTYRNYKMIFDLNHLAILVIDQSSPAKMNAFSRTLVTLLQI